MELHRQIGSNFYSPVVLTALVLNFMIFAAFYGLATSSTRSDVAFVAEELEGLRQHREAMQRYRAVPDDMLFEQMRDIADDSNLILDPELGSYYLMNLVIRIAPDMMQLQTLPINAGNNAYMRRLVAKAQRSLRVAQDSGVDVTPMIETLAQINRPEAKLIDAPLDQLYQQAADGLRLQLEARKKRDERLWRTIGLTIAAMSLCAAFLISVAMSYYQRQRAFRLAHERLAMLDQLEKASAELERFSYFTAHDLKEPVRSICCFGTLLREAIERKDDKQSAEYLAIIEQSSQRMARLIDGILAYLMVGKHTPDQAVSLRLSEAVEAVLRDLKSAIDESGALITVKALPTATLPPIALHRVLMNLISNAIRYRHPERRCEIYISAEWSNALGWKMNIVDNGIGFNSRYVAKAFEPFQRLHPDEDIKGSGIGLSICKKLVEGWGGTIGASAQEGQGAQFYFTVPASAHPKPESGGLPASTARAKQQAIN